MQNTPNRSGQNQGQGTGQNMGQNVGQQGAQGVGGRTGGNVGGSTGGNVGGAGGNMGGGNFGQEWTNAPFVKRFEMGLMQFVILHKARQGEVTRDNLQQTFRGNLQMSGDHFEHCLRQLVSDGHLEEVGGNKYRITDDGREDIEKIARLVPEMQQFANVGGQQRQGVTQQSTTGGVGGGMGGSTGGNVGGTGGNVGGGQRR